VSIKTTFKATTIALVLAAAAGFYYFGRGGKLDTSKDRNILLHVEYHLDRPWPGTIAVYINEANRTDEGIQKPPWDDHMWIRPGETVRLTGHTMGRGRLICQITDGDKVLTDPKYGSDHWSDLFCSVSVTG
jgi:hypothetical protein